MPLLTQRLNLSRTYIDKELPSVLHNNPAYYQWTYPRDDTGVHQNRRIKVIMIGTDAISMPVRLLDNMAKLSNKHVT